MCAALRFLQWRNIPITMQNCAIIQVLSFLLDIALDVGSFAIFAVAK